MLGSIEDMDKETVDTDKAMVVAEQEDIHGNAGAILYVLLNTTSQGHI
jgi:hypothetical protein